MSWPARLLRATRLCIPVALLGVGLTLLVGCIYVPSSFRYQQDGKPRPESLVGRSNQIVVGETHIADALLAVRNLNPDTPARNEQPYSRDQPQMAWFGLVHVSDDGRTLAIEYTLNTGVIVYPLCLFYGDVQSEGRWLLFDVDDRGVVVNTHTSSQLSPKRFQGGTMERDILSETSAPETLARLSQAGIIWTGEQHERFQHGQQAAGQKMNAGRVNPATAPAGNGQPSTMPQSIHP